jgi:7-cyano-7-deazaguanine synthase
VSSVVLLSGGVDSAALASWLRPDQALFIDYGQVAALGEHRASERVARELGVPWASIAANCHAVGSGLLAGVAASAQAPSPEWWPFRNQLLATLGSAWAIGHGFSEVLFGVVAGDDDRHRDASKWFFESLDALTSGQEGGIRVRAPALNLTTLALIEIGAVQRRVLGWTFSCHSSPLGCGLCPGCTKRDGALAPFLSVASHEP